MSRRSRMLVGVLLVAAACSDGTGPAAGTLTVSLTTPNSGQDEAVLLVVTSPAPPASEQAAGSLVLWWAGTPGTADTLALTGTLSGGALLTLGVSDVNQVSHYHVQLVQVAAVGTHALRSLTGYSVGIAK